MNTLSSIKTLVACHLQHYDSKQEYQLNSDVLFRYGQNIHVFLVPGFYSYCCGSSNYFNNEGHHNAQLTSQSHDSENT